MKDNWLTDDEVKRILGLSDEQVVDNNRELVKPNGEMESEEDGEPRKPVEVYPVEFQSFDSREENEKIKNEFKILNDIPMEVRVVLAKVQKTIEEITELATGDVVPTERLAGEPVDIMVGRQIIAKGEIVIIEDKFGVFITEIVSPEERIRKAQSKLGERK